MASVVVVGAGIAGLTAACRLSRQGIGVTVLEAACRVGGRMTTDRRDGYLIDRGAQFLSDGYEVIGELIRELGLARHVRRAGRWSGIVRGAAVRRINARYPWTLGSSGLLRWRDVARTAGASLALSLRSRGLPLGDYSRWHALDDADAAEWIAASFGQDVLEYVFEPMLEGFYFQAPEKMSRAWPALLWSFGARGKRPIALAGGLGSLPQALAQRVQVRLCTACESIEKRGAGVSVRTAAGALRADYVVLATTAPVARRLYVPEHEVEDRLLRTAYSASINVAIAVPEGFTGSRVAADIYGLLIPRRERQAIAAVALESRKCGSYVPRGELLNVMLSGEAGQRLIDSPDASVLNEVLPEVRRYFPGIDGRIAFAQLCRWHAAEPHSPVGRCRDLAHYRRKWHPGMKIILAGDYMGSPCTEGAADSGAWAAARLAAAAA